MKGYQHFLFSLLIALALLWPLEGDDALLAFLFALGALLPDLDARHSAAKAGRLALLPQWGDRLLSALALLALPLLPFFGRRHRGCFHSLYAALALFLWSYLLFSLLGLDWRYAAALALGFAAHIAEDAATPGGVRPLCSFSVRGRMGPLRGALLDGAVALGFAVLPFNPKAALFTALLAYLISFL